LQPQNERRIQIGALVMVVFFVARGFHGLQSKDLVLLQFSFTTTNGNTTMDDLSTRATPAIFNETNLGIHWEIESIYHPRMKSERDNKAAENQDGASSTSTLIATPDTLVGGKEDFHHSNAAILDL
jgi:hypothetical protein